MPTMVPSHLGMVSREISVCSTLLTTSGAQTGIALVAQRPFDVHGLLLLHAYQPISYKLA